MIIAMTLSMSGGRDDGRPWFGIGIPFEVPDEEGAGLVFWHHAVDLTGRVALEQLAPNARIPGTVTAEVPAPVSLPAETAAGPVDEAPPAVDEAPPVVEEAPPVVKTAPDHEWHSPPDAVADDDPDPEPDLVIDAPAEPPKPADPKQAWYDYAVTQGLTGKKIEDVTKADLMSQYGGRL